MRNKLFISALMFTLIFLSNFAQANALNEVEIRLICALSSMASYEDDNGVLIRDMIASYGWNIEPIRDESSKANVKAIVISKQLDDRSLMKILSICGTNDLKDAEVDLRLKRVPVGSSIGSEEILVHQGFQDYADVILKDNFGTNLVKELAGNPNERLYLTGHSLGGAVAILTAVKLVNLGAASDQIEVVAFGAPAVGNKGFVNEYENKINLKRVTMSGDPIKKSLQVLGYVHFGEVVKYNPSKAMIEHFPHKMALYLDCAIRDYYDSNSEIQSAIAYNPEVVYIAPMQVMKNSFTEEDFKYVKTAMRDQLRRKFPAAIYDEVDYLEVEEVDALADFDDSIEDIVTKASALNCKYIVVYYLQARKMKNDREGNYRVSLEEVKYDLKGFPISMQTASVTTTELTMLEAALFAQQNLIRS